MKSKLLILIIALLSFSSLSAQDLLLPENNPAYSILDRLQVKTGIQSEFHTSLKSYTRGDVFRYAYALLQSDYPFTDQDKKELFYVINDNLPYLSERFDPEIQSFLESSMFNEKALLRYFYKTKAGLFEYAQPNFLMIANPVLNLGVGKDTKQDELIYRNTRGLSLSAVVDNRFYLHSSIFENQRNFMSYVDRTIAKHRAIPGQGLYKSYNSSLVDSVIGYDFLNAQAYVGTQLSKHVGVRFGHGKFFIGNGIRSLLLSDYGNNYLYLNVNTRFGNLHYQNIFAELAGVSVNWPKPDRVLTKKYMTTHYLNYRFTPWLEVGLFETVVFYRDAGFDMQYLNPVIFYRAVEGLINSPDNVILGANAKLDLFKSVSLYGQVILDEFKFNEVIAQEGWWANKFGLQLGLKYYDVAGIDHLNLQAETNIVRPYTYSHRDSLNSFSHYNQVLAHPLGANFEEYIARISYQFNHKTSIMAEALIANYGADGPGENWGGDILLSYNSREQEYGNFVGQGVPISVQQFRMKFSYQWYHNCHLDLNLLYRKEHNGDTDTNMDNLYIGSSFRVNISDNDVEY